MKNEKKNVNPAVKFIPHGFHSLTPYVVVENASAFIDFITRGLGANLTYIMKDEETNLVVHATAKIGDSTLMISDVMEGMEAKTCMLFLYVKDMDSVYQKALKANGISVREPLNEFYGDRAACIKDEWGNLWWIATHIEDVSEEELKRRKEQMSKQHA